MKGGGTPQTESEIEVLLAELGVAYRLLDRPFGEGKGRDAVL